MASINLGGSVGTTAVVAILGNYNVVFASDANHTLSSTEYSNYFLEVTSSVSLTAQRNLVAPLVQGQTFIVHNRTTGGQPIQIIGSSGTGIIIPNGLIVTVVCDGANYHETSGGASGSFVFQPGGTVGPNVFTTESGLNSAVSTISGPITVYLDFSHVGDTYSLADNLNLGSAATLVGISDPANIGTFPQPILITNGFQINGVVEIQNLFIQVSTATATSNAFVGQLTIRNSLITSNDGNVFCAISTFSIMNLLENSVLGDGTNPVFSVTSVNLDINLYDSCSIPANAFTLSGAAVVISILDGTNTGVDISYFSDSSFTINYVNVQVPRSTVAQFVWPDPRGFITTFEELIQYAGNYYNTVNRVSYIDIKFTQNYMFESGTPEILNLNSISGLLPSYLFVALPGTFNVVHGSPNVTASVSQTLVANDLIKLGGTNYVISSISGGVNIVLATNYGGTTNTAITGSYATYPLLTELTVPSGIHTTQLESLTDIRNLKLTNLGNQAFIIGPNYPAIQGGVVNLENVTTVNTGGPFSYTFQYYGIGTATFNCENCNFGSGTFGLTVQHSDQNYVINLRGSTLSAGAIQQILYTSGSITIYADSSSTVDPSYYSISGVAVRLTYTPDPIVTFQPGGTAGGTTFTDFQTLCIYMAAQQNTIFDWTIIVDGLNVSGGVCQIAEGNYPLPTNVEFRGMIDNNGVAPTLKLLADVVFTPHPSVFRARDCQFIWENTSSPVIQYSSNSDNATVQLYNVKMSGPSTDAFFSVTGGAFLNCQLREGCVLSTSGTTIFDVDATSTVQMGMWDRSKISAGIITLASGGVGEIDYDSTAQGQDQYFGVTGFTVLPIYIPDNIVTYQPGGTTSGTTFTNFGQLCDYIAAVGTQVVDWIIKFDGSFGSTIPSGTYHLPDNVTFEGITLASSGNSPTLTLSADVTFTGTSAPPASVDFINISIVVQNTTNPVLTYVGTQTFCNLIDTDIQSQGTQPLIAYTSGASAFLTASSPALPGGVGFTNGGSAVITIDATSGISINLFNGPHITSGAVTITAGGSCSITYDATCNSFGVTSLIGSAGFNITAADSAAAINTVAGITVNGGSYSINTTATSYRANTTSGNVNYTLPPVSQLPFNGFRVWIWLVVSTGANAITVKSDNSTGDQIINPDTGAYQATAWSSATTGNIQGTVVMFEWCTQQNVWMSMLSVPGVR